MMRRAIAVATRRLRVSPSATARGAAQTLRLHDGAVLASTHSADAWRCHRVRGMATPPTTQTPTFSASPTPSMDSGSRALEKARECIDQHDIAQAMKFLNIAAHEEVADAQYLLGTLLEKDAEEADDDDAGAQAPDALIQDAETKRQLANDPDQPQDLRTIRKQARQHYRAYLRSRQTTSSDTKGMPRIVERSTPSQLDRAFGVTLQQLLDPAGKLRTLAEVAAEERANAALSSDSTQAVEWLRRAAANGHRDAIVYLGNLCLEQEPPLAQHALEWYFQVTPPKCETDPHPDALFNIGTILYGGVEDAEPPVDCNRAAAIPYFVRAAEEGDKSAQFLMGQLLHAGDEELGIEPNATSALMLIERAAEPEEDGTAHTGAMFYLAQLYRSGDAENGIAADESKFLHYLDQAMEGGDDEALFCMADMYYHGSDGFVQDLEQARMFYLASAEAGNADAFCCLGALYYSGQGVKQDYEKAFLYYQEAADRHSMEAWKNLADMYYAGRGVPQNRATADSILKMLRKMEQEQEQELEDAPEQ